MFVLCDNCHNHYDDDNQSSECAGIGVTVARPTGSGSAHAFTKHETAGDAHATYTRAARALHAHHAAMKGPERAATGSPRAADPSDV